MANIEKLIEDAKLALDEMYERELNMAIAKSVQVALRQYASTQSIEKILNDLKIELVSGIVEEEALVKNRYKVVFLKINSGSIELQEGDIPIWYQSYMSMFSSGSSSGTCAGGQEIVREIIVLRPVEAV